METTTGTKLFRNKSFLYLIAAQSVSSLGDWLDILALFTLVALKWNATPMQMALVILCLAGPMVIFGPITGVLADRMNRKALMILSDVVRALLVLSLIWVTDITQVYLVLVFKGVFQAFFTPAKNGILKEIIPDEQMEQATTLSTIIDQAAKIVGPMLSGVLVATLGIVSAFYIDAATFIISALLLSGVPGNHTAVTVSSKEKKTTFVQDLKEGLQYVSQIPFLLYGTLLFSIVMLVLQIADSQVMILFREIQNVTPGLIGTAMAASGLGLILSAGLLSKKPSQSPLALMAIGSVGIGLVYASAGFATQFASIAWLLYPALFFVGGATAGMVIIPFQAGAQKRTPVELSGRVFGTISSVVTAAVIVGPMVGALLATSFGVVTAFMVAGCSLAVIGVISFFGKNTIERRDLDVAQGTGGTQGTTAS